MKIIDDFFASSDTLSQDFDCIGFANASESCVLGKTNFFWNVWILLSLTYSCFNLVG